MRWYQTSYYQGREAVAAEYENNLIIGRQVAKCLSEIPNDKQFAHVKVQARSYAKLLGARFSVIASKEKVWITTFGDDYDRCVFEETWESLSDTDVFYRLEKLIGKRQVM